MHPTNVLITLLSLATTPHAAVVNINVGEKGLTFTPDNVKAEVGDVLEFHFVGGLHDAVTGDLDKPCQPAAGGAEAGAFASGSVTGSAGNKNVFRVTVNTTDPIYYYCSVGQHCANGMVAAINAPNDDAVAAYRTAAKGKTSTRPVGVFGGEFGTAA